MAKTVSIKPEEQLARSYADRLILAKLSEMESAVKLGELADSLSSVGLGLAAVRSLLASNPDRFAFFERRWVPAARVAGRGRPLSHAAQLVLESFGSPIPVAMLSQEIALARSEAPELVEPTVRRIVRTDPQFVFDARENVSLVRWAFIATDEPLERALALNRVNREEFDAAAKKLSSVDWRAEEGVKNALELASPIKLKTLGAVAYSVLSPEDPRAIGMYDAATFLKLVLQVPGFILGPEGLIATVAEAQRWVGVAVRLADKLAPAIEVEDAAPIDVKPEDIARMVARIKASDGSMTATRILEEFYEITPSNKTFPDDLANVMAALKAEADVAWVGGDRFRVSGDQPDFILEVPEPFNFVQSGVLDEEGELVDVELTDDGLGSSLRKLLAHPLATDVLDEDLMPAPKTMPESIRLVLKSIHKELGTFPMCQIPTNWIAHEPNIQEIVLIDPTGRELSAWVNHEARLTYGFLEWWFDQPMESGAVFTLTKTPKPNVFDFAWLDQPDPVVYISANRMEELRRIGDEAEGRSTLDLLIEVMGHWPKGADYLTLLAEVNVVRRSSRRLIASLLSSYQCFYQRSGSPVWHYDNKKLDQGFDKTKKKFIKK